MHEYSIVQALLEKVEEEAKARSASRVQRVCVRIGELAGIEIPLLEWAYESFREGTSCAAAPLEIVATPAVWSCPRCQRQLEKGAALRCVDCDVGAQLLAGDEILLERIVMEVP